MIAAHLRKNAIPLCVNLASVEYARVVQFDQLPADCIHVHFKEPGPKGLRTVAVRAKRARGLMAGFLIRQQARTRKDLESFCEGGYYYAPEESQHTDVVFVYDKARG